MIKRLLFLSAIVTLFSACTANTSCCVDANGYYNSVCGRYSCTDPNLVPPPGNLAGCETCATVKPMPCEQTRVVAVHETRRVNYKDSGAY